MDADVCTVLLSDAYSLESRMHDVWVVDIRRNSSAGTHDLVVSGPNARSSTRKRRRTVGIFNHASRNVTSRRVARPQKNGTATPAGGAVGHGCRRRRVRHGHLAR